MLRATTSYWQEVRNDEPRPGDLVGRRAAAVEAAGDAARVHRACAPGAGSGRKLRRLPAGAGEPGTGAASGQSGAAALDGSAVSSTEDFGEDGPEEVAGHG